MLKKPELVFIPLPEMGHLVPTVQVAKLLVDLNPNLFITVLNIKPPYDSKITAFIDSLTADITTATTSHLKFIDLPQSDQDDASKFMSSLVQTQGPFVKEAVANIVEHSNSVPDSPRLAGFVLDMFLTPFLELANEFGVPSYSFYTSGASFLGFLFDVRVLHDEQNVDFAELQGSDIEFNFSTYVNPVSIKLFPTGMLKPEGFTLFLDITEGLRQMKGIMVNTFLELELHAINFLSRGKLQIPPIYPFRCGSSGRDRLRARAEWTPVLVVLTATNEASKGMMGRPADYENVAEALPEGFLDRTVGIGKVIGWAPQVAILGHPATGGFVSHCGWNSTLESIWFGVPMAAWPLKADQHMNSLTMVRELGLAVEIKTDYSINDGEIEIVKAKKIEKGI
ncbi:Pectinesterase [Hibiscus syriacus]|uniref:Pectinesterase n=1 Tax=Hibiscus syriacus TaxID=106335 RepID=A0A6A3AKV5_HIBSY|nr:Pectinesterase [Hibiscus syriacus]